jgi:hypothetical protein
VLRADVPQPEPGPQGMQPRPARRRTVSGPPLLPPRPPVPEVDEPGPGALSGRAAFRHWRRTRPFWGGLWCIVGGLVIAAGPSTAVRVILIAGTAVWLGILVGVLVGLMGFFIWFQPQLRQLCGILAALLSVLSLLTSDYGGFVLGMSFGIVGGGLAFAWTPAPPKAAQPHPPEPEPEHQTPLPL